jgi:hypothetical protein
MGKGLFKRGGGNSIQAKIDALKEKRKKREREQEISEAIPSSIPMPAATAEEERYLQSLERNLKEGKSVIGAMAGMSKRKQQRKPKPVSEEEEIEGRQLNPFSVERDVEKMVLAAQERFERSLPEKEPLPVGNPDDLFQANGDAEQEFDKDIEEEPEPLPLPPQQTPPSEPSPQEKYESQGNLPFPPGTIVRLGDDSVGIIKEQIRNREYDLVYILCADGRVEPRGVCLYAYQLEKLGRLPLGELDRIQSKMFWNRDRLIFHLDDISYAAGIPQRGTAAPPAPQRSPVSSTPVAPEPEDDGHSLQRGRKLTVNVGGKKWEAVYWGRDSLGPILAHSQGKDWELLHMDLDRFGPSVEPGRLLRREEIHEIQECVIRKISDPSHHR